MQTLDDHFDVGPDGRLSDRGARAIRQHLRAATRGLEEGETLTLRFRVSQKLRTGAQNRLYWSVLGRVSLAFVESTGRAYSTDALHLYCKERLLPLAAAECERETGEVVEYRRELAMPGGASRVTYTTTALSVEAFTVYLDRIEEHFVVELGLPVDLSDMVEERRGLRSGRIEEASDLATVPMGDAADEYLEAEAAHRAEVDPQPLSAETTAYEMQLRAAELW